MIRTFIQVTSLVLTLEAAIFLAKGGLGLSAVAIAQLSSTKWGYNLDLVSSLSQQRADTFIGVLLLLIAFGLQMANALWPMSWNDFAVHRGAVGYALVFCVVLGFGAFFLGREMASHTATEVEAILRPTVESPDATGAEPN